MTFGKKLRAARLAAGLSQGELADDRCSLSYISHLETGRRSPTPELVRYFESRLGLAAGELSDIAEVTNSQRRRIEEADLLAAYGEAFESWRAGNFALALQQAQRVQAALPMRGREDLHSLLNILLININIDLGHYREATVDASRHWHEAAASGSPALEARAACIASRAARLAGDGELALEAAHTAMSLTAGRHGAPSVRADALRSTIAAYCESDEDVTGLIDELRSLAHELEGSNEHGLSAWVLGNAEFRAGNIAAGIKWHDEALTSLSASADLRNWARFPRASAEERLNSGTQTGVESLLAIAEQRLRVLDSADELATLALVRAKLAVAQDNDAGALACVATALEELDLPPRTQAKLYLMGAGSQGRLGRTQEATAMALKAARLFTDAGDSTRAQDAWRIVDEHSLSA